MKIAILAGGRSLRLGQDKATLFLPHIIKVAQTTGKPVVVVGRASPLNIEGVDSLPDDAPDIGPLGGLGAALRFARGETVLALACDLPLLNASALTWLIECWESVEEKPDCSGIVPLHPNSGLLEPLFAVYSSLSLARIESHLLSGRRSLQGLFLEGGFEFAEIPPEIAHCLTNVNTPADLAALGSQAGLRP